MEPRPRATYEPGQVLPGTVYRVVRHLATGGMGTVYEVEDTSVEKRYVLKTLHPQLVAREDLARRMRDEAKSLAKLEHPNIVAVITAGVTSDALRMPFYVMERLVGQNLRVVLQKKGVIELLPALRIAIDVLDALEHAHENAIVHRDVKPENIFLHRNVNGTTTTKLLDFGIVRLLDRTVGETSGKFIGTLRYASPEQVTGGQIDRATDLYSLGLVLYEMLVGRGPFDDAGDAYAIGVAQVNQAPPPPAALAGAPMPASLERLVLSALAKEAGARPRDAFTFATELRRILRDEESRPSGATAVDVLSGAPETIADPPDDTAPVSPVAPTVAAVDRAAPTRTSTPGGSTQRLPAHDTRVADSDRVALAASAPRPAAGAPGEALLPVAAVQAAPAQAPSAGPLAIPARERPPERATVPLVAAVGGVAALAALVGVVMLVARGSSTKAKPAAPSSAPLVASIAPAPPALSSADLADARPPSLAASTATVASPTPVASARLAVSAARPAGRPAQSHGPSHGTTPTSTRAPEIRFDP